MPRSGRRCSRRLQERAKELTLPLSRQRDLQAAAGLARRDLPGRHRRPAAGLAIPCRLLGSDHGRTASVYEPPWFEGDSRGVQAAPIRVQGEAGGQRRGLLPPRHARRGRGAVSEGGEAAYRHGRRAPRAAAPPAPAARRAPGRQGRRRPGAPRGRLVAVIIDFLRKIDQLLPRADRAPHDQLPLLERHRRSPGPPAALHGGPGGRRRDENRPIEPEPRLL